jgi:hypothetical protein
MIEKLQEAGLNLASRLAPGCVTVLRDAHGKTSPAAPVNVHNRAYRVTESDSLDVPGIDPIVP